MAGRQPLHSLTDPSGYVSPAVYPPSNPGSQWASDIAAQHQAEGIQVAPTPVAVPPRGISFGGVRLPFTFGIEHLGVNALL